VFVFVFFGLVATVGTTYVAVERITGASIVTGCAAGCLACSLLVVNNLRDIPGDTVAGKRTLAVRLGDARTRVLYVALLVAAGLLVLGAAAWRPWVLLALLAAPLARPAVVAVRGDARGPALIPVLGATGRFQLAFGALATLGLLLSS
jgi:1,4-dihydroxy-2-naphthoate octaprenyltransferase